MIIDTAYVRGLPLRDRIENNYIPITECGCWIWTRKVSSTGYGCIDINGKTVLAHRASWAVHRGPIPDNLCVLHRCDVRPCINPDHLFLGDLTDNARDRSQKGRSANRRGANNNNAKLTDSAVRDICSSPVSNREMADKYGLDLRSVWAIRHGIGWKHVA